MTDLLENGWVVVVKRDCSTCELVQPVLCKMMNFETPLQVFSQDDPDFPEGIANVEDDRDLEQSFRLDIETVPTLIRRENGQEVERTLGWDQGDWRELTGIEGLGKELPEFQPGCGSLSAEPGVEERLQVKFGKVPFLSRKVPISETEDYLKSMTEFDNIIGFDRLKIVHVNDSKKELGSRVDRHEHIGKGEIGLAGFQNFVNDARFREIPMVIETPKEDDLTEDIENLKILRSLVTD